jgi:hypothetical protein
MTEPHKRHPGYETDPPPRKVMGVEIRQKPDDLAPTSISPSGLLGWAARHGRTWSPIGVALMFALILASVIGGATYFLGSDAGKALIAALQANTEAVKRLESKVEGLEAKADEALAGNKAIREQLRMNGSSDATMRLGRLENNDRITGQFLVELNGARPNTSFPRSLKDDWTRPPDAPLPVLPLLKTDQQWALKPE